MWTTSPSTSTPSSTCASVARSLTRPHARECLVCYVLRMLNEFGCDTTLRFARGYRDLRAPRATALETRLGNMGGFCDCEIFLNGMRRAPHLRHLRRARR